MTGGLGRMILRMTTSLEFSMRDARRSCLSISKLASEQEAAPSTRPISSFKVVRLQVEARVHELPNARHSARETIRSEGNFTLRGNARDSPFPRRRFHGSGSRVDLYEPSFDPSRAIKSMDIGSRVAGRSDISIKMRDRDMNNHGVLPPAVRSRF